QSVGLCGVPSASQDRYGVLGQVSEPAHLRAQLRKLIMPRGRLRPAPTPEQFTDRPPMLVVVLGQPFRVDVDLAPTTTCPIVASVYRFALGPAFLLVDVVQHLLRCSFGESHRNGERRWPRRYPRAVGVGEAHRVAAQFLFWNPTELG